MKKIFYLASIAALALSSCTKDETTEATLAPVNNGSKIVAAMEADDTRSELVASGSGYEIVWKSSDALSVFSNATGVEAMPNERFQLDNASDGVASGAFSSKRGTLNASKKYLALYPYSESYDNFQPVWNRVEYPGVQGYEVKGLLAYKDVNMTIPATQDYVPGSFDTNTIPAISSEFTVGDNNTATVKMQPVVDFLMVDIVSTEPITEIKLEIYKGSISNANRVNIAGTGALDAYKVGDNTRYVLTSNELSEPTITLNTKQLASDVALAEANTYVFAIPGGLLGSFDTVNGTSDDLYIPVVYVTDGNKTQWFKATNNVNYYMATPTVMASRVTGMDVRYLSYLDLVYYTQNRENTVFYMNKKDATTGERVAFEFNPYDEALIYDELDLIEYIVDYKTDKNNAYVAEDAVFDLSVSHLSKILSESDIRTKHPALYAAINGYIAGTSQFPVIDEYNNEFKGNGAAITNIEKPLESIFGLFGNLGDNAKISDLVLSNIVAATAVEGKGELDSQEDYNANGVEKETVKGVVLANEVGNKQISNITVSNLDADAVVGSGDLSVYNAFKVGEAGLNKKLNHIMQSVNMTGNLTYKAEAWDAVATVNESVFNTIVPDSYTNDGQPVTHTIATLPAGAKYEKFVDVVDYTGGHTNVLSVLIDGTSYWTGGKIASAINVSKHYNANKGKYNNYTAIRYAEELAGEYDGEVNLYLVRDLDMNYNNNNTSWTTNSNVWNELYGAGFTVKGLTMLSKADEKKDITDSHGHTIAAPFQVITIDNVNFDGININVVTTLNEYAVPALISGLSNNLEMVKNVNIKNIEIMGSSKNEVQKDEPHYNGQVWLGWLSAEATDIEVNKVTINGAKTNLSAVSAAVATLTLEGLTSWFNDFSISNIAAHSKATNLSAFAAYDGKVANVKGTAVANVNLNSDTVAKSSVKFDNSGSPKFTYNITGDNEEAYINVLYNDKVVETLRHPDYEE